MSDAPSQDWTELLPRIRAVVARLAAPQDVDDLTQECCARVIGAERLWDPERGSRRGWAAAIARNLARNHHRRRRQHAPLPAEVATPGEEPAMPEDRISWLLGQFRTLPPAGRELLRLRYFDGLPVTEIARRLGINQPTASKRLAKTVDRLRRRARAQGFLQSFLPAPLAGALAGVSKMKLAAAAVVASAGGLFACGFFTPSPDVHLVADTADLRRTTFAATLEHEVLPRRNLAWAATTPAAWAELERALGGPPRFRPPVETARRLSRARFDRGSVPEDALVAGAGRIADGVVARLQERVDAAFGRGPDPALDRFTRGLAGDAIVTYAFLARDLEFRYAFDVLDEMPLRWIEPEGAGTREIPVGAFGIRKVDLGRPRHERLVRQVKVERYTSPEEFVIRLLGRDRGAEIVVARMAPEATLAATVARVQGWMDAPDPQDLTHDDRLAIPRLDFHLSHEYREFAGATLVGPAAADQTLVLLQTLRFRLDERGAELRSRSLGAVGAIVRPRHFVASGPFLLMMREQGKREPYLVLWIGDPELLVRLDGTPK